MGKQKKAKKQMKVHKSSPAKSKQHTKVQNSIANAFLRPNAIPFTPPTKQSTMHDTPTPAPPIQVSEPESTPLTSNKMIDPTEDPSTTNNLQVYPPNQDMDNDDTSYLSVAKSSKDLPVVEKPVSTSFLLKKNFMTKVLHVPIIAALTGFTT